MFTVNRDPDNAELKKFGWSMVIGFGVLGAIAWCLPWLKAWWLGDPRPALGWSAAGSHTASLVLWGVGAACTAVSFGPRPVARALYVGWMSVVVPVGLVMSTVMLTVLFVLLLPVFSLVVRAGDPLRKKLKPDGSYWEDYKPHEPTLERMQRPF